MPLRALLLAFAACAESAPGDPVDVLPDLSTVYECGGTSHVIGEWCFDGEAGELSALVGAPCWPSEHERFKVGPLGQSHPVCVYSCEPGHQGCNSLAGCFCP